MLIFISLPGFFDGSDFFTADEKARLNAWLAVGSNRIVPIGEWDGFYSGQAVMEDLLAAIGNPIVFTPGAYDSGCGHCDGTVTADPVVLGLDHVCYAFTATWDPSFGAPVAYAEDPAAAALVAAAVVEDLLDVFRFNLIQGTKNLGLSSRLRRALGVWGRGRLSDAVPEARRGRGGRQEIRARQAGLHQLVSELRQ